MPKRYRYNLGVDLGIASIGTALVQVDKNNRPVGILDAGVRTFATPGGAGERRQKRLERKHLRRKKQRLAALQKLLRENALLPDSKANFEELIGKNPYVLRAQGVTSPFTNLHDLGRCLLHMAKFRGAGFLTQMEELNAKSDDEDIIDNETKSANDRQKTADSYRKLETECDDRNITLSQFFAERLNNKKPIRRRKFHVERKDVDYAVPRFLVKDEFKRIWTTQANHHPILTDSLREKIYKELFKEFPHAPYATGNCSLVPTEKRLPKMHRLSEQRRIYEQINNIRYLTPAGDFPLPRKVRDKLVILAFDKGKDLSKKEIKREIDVATQDKVIRINIDETSSKIKGFCQNQAFEDIPVWQNIRLEKRDEIIDFIAEPRRDPTDENSELLPDDEFIEKLCEKLCICRKVWEKRITTTINKLPPERSNLGISATKHILEKLIEGKITTEIFADGKEQKIWRPHTHRTAADACGFKAEEEELREKRGSFDFLPYYGEILSRDLTPIHPWHIKRATKEEARHGRLPNPVVHVALNQLRKVVNEIVKLYGKPQGIHIEMARELGMSAVKRGKFVKEQQFREKENQRIDQELKKLGLAPGRRNRTKYKLWEEQGSKSIFSLLPIEASEISSCEIEHLIPQSHGGTSSYINLALVHANENLAKGNLFPYEFLQNNFPDRFKERDKILAAKNFPKGKAWRFSKNAKEKYSIEGDEEQTDHRLTDTSYMAKLGARYLSMLCHDVVAVKGGTTAHLRHLWGLDGLEYEIAGLPVKKHLFDAQTGEVQIDPLTGYPARNPHWQAKPRIDHRHHALDALVTACTDRQMVKNIVLAEKRDQGKPNIDPPFGENTTNFRQQVLNALKSVLVAPKSEHGKAGQLHDATKYRILKKGEADLYRIKYRRSLDKIKTERNVSDILFNTNTIPLDNEATRTAYMQCQRIIQAIKQNYSKAEEDIAASDMADQRVGKKVTARNANVQERAVVGQAIKLAQDAGLLGSTYPKLDNKKLVAINEKLRFGFEPRNNYCMDFFENKGKVDWECITRFKANTSSIEALRKQRGHKLIWSLHINDVVEVTMTAELKEQLHASCPVGKCYFRVQQLAAGRIYFVFLHDARSVSKSTGNQENNVAWKADIGLTKVCKLATRKIELNPFGKIHRKHKKLWDGVKKT
jgi:CRISPR-associated endonuclease Csn1